MKELSSASDKEAIGRVLSLHLHPKQAGDAMINVLEFTLETDNGIVENTRYFAKRRSNGNLSRRQVSLIEREVLDDHASALSVVTFPSGAARANIESNGIELAAYLQRTVHIGTAILFFYAHRDPCSKMDALTPGLRERMLNGRQGVLAQVVQGGLIRVGDNIQVLSETLPVI